jgi:hypothetical protein
LDIIATHLRLKGNKGRVKILTQMKGNKMLLVRSDGIRGSVKVTNQKVHGSIPLLDIFLVLVLCCIEMHGLRGWLAERI